MQPEYCVVLADTIASSRLPVADRMDLQVRLSAAVKAINKQFEQALVVPSRITAGDAVVAVLVSRTASYDIACLLESAAFPQGMRFAMGTGVLSVPVGPDAEMLDGPAFHRAQAAMQVLKNRKQCHGRLMLYETDDPHWDRIANALANLVWALRTAWTAKERRRVAAINEASTIARAAAALGVTVQVLYRTRRTTHLETVGEGERLLRELLRNRDVGKWC